MPGTLERSNRDDWCTPEWLARPLGLFDLDPCSNARSHIRSRFTCSLDRGENGLCEDDGDGVFGSGSFTDAYHTLNRIETNYAGAGHRVFINPPYSRGQVIRWVRHYKHTDFTFLLRWDPSTTWFRELMNETSYVFFPSRRINFEPPPGIRASSNPYPHALFFRHRPPASLNEPGAGVILSNDYIHRDPGEMLSGHSDDLRP